MKNEELNRSQERPQLLAPQAIIASCEPPLTSGSGLLKRPEAAEIVQKALLFFEGDRYLLSAWCIMPNHVHVVVSPLGENHFSRILHSWKSFPSNQINKLLNREGTLWQRESFDHLIRSADHWEKFIYYVENNPVEAGLCRSPKDWPFSSCGAGFQPAPNLELIDPRKTPFSELRSRGELPHIAKEGVTYFVTFRLADAVAPKARAGWKPAPQPKGDDHEFP